METGTYRGDGARLLAATFPEVVTIELSPELYDIASRSLAAVANVRTVQGDSRAELEPLAAEGVPTLYFLDGHWSQGATAGEDVQCPLLDELEALRGGHADDCLVVDDARHFAAPPPPPLDPRLWPTLIEVLDKIREQWPEHYVTVVHDQIIAVPRRAKPVVDGFGQRPLSQRRAALRRVGTRLRQEWRRPLAALRRP